MGIKKKIAMSVFYAFILILSAISAFAHELHKHAREERGAKWPTVGDMCAVQYPDLLSKIDVSEFYLKQAIKEEPISIYYQLSKPAKVRVIIGAKGNSSLFLRTLVGWEERSAGVHAEKWDGLDESGNPIDPRRYAIKIEAEPLSMSKNISSLEAKEINEDMEHLRGHLHGGHEKEKCGKFDIRIDQPVSETVLKDLVTVKTALTGRFRGYSNEWGFGVRYYLDGTLVSEEFIDPKDAKDVQTFEHTFDTNRYPDGPHTITVNICDHNKHEGTTSIPVWINNNKK